MNNSLSELQMRGGDVQLVVRYARLVLMRLFIARNRCVITAFLEERISLEQIALARRSEPGVKRDMPSL